MTESASPGTGFDYIVIGAGSAGCVLANRLTEDPSIRVLVLEAGGWDKDPFIHIPLGLDRIFGNRLHDWGYFSEPEPGMDGRRIECARGQVIGGSSSINFMAYVRGHRNDYDRWRQLGCKGWAYADVLPYFRRSEAWEGEESVYRGTDGPLTVRTSTHRDPVFEGLAQAAQSAGHPLVEDANGAEQHGFTSMQQTIRKGRRCSAAVAYLQPALSRPNLFVQTGALVERLNIEGHRVRGVSYRRRGESRSVDAEREVLLCGGVINSPQILMLSGIGPAEHLREHDIQAVQDLPGVGRNLQDHLSALIHYRRRVPGPLTAQLRYDRLAVNLVRAYLWGKGPATDLPVNVHAFVKSRPELDIPDTQMLVIAASPQAVPWMPGIRSPSPDGLVLRPVLLRPASRGEVKLRSANPADSVRIHQNFLSAPEDQKTLRDGFRVIREIGAQPALRHFGLEEIAPGPAAQNDEDLDAYLRATSATAHHPAGTCKMGTDEMAVVDPDLKVRGVEGLRVIDASIMPDLVGGNINAPVMKIAERISDLIRGRPLLARAEV